MGLLGLGAAMTLAACSSAVRTRLMHFFFEYPPASVATTAPPTQPATPHDAIAMGTGPPPRFASRHRPFVQRECQDCHIRGLGQAPRPDFTAACRQCHEPLFAYHRYGHAPAVTHDCRSCHLMHVSRNEALLKAPQRELCVSCHPAQQSEDALSSYHRGIEAIRCTACHDPHFADNPLLLKPETTRQEVREVQRVDG